MKNSSRLLITLLVAIFIFAIAIILPKLLITGPINKIATTQILELGLSILAIGILGKGRFREYGFCLPQPGSITPSRLASWFYPAVAAFVVGALATLALLGTGGSGNPLVKQLSLPQMILFVWIFSSTIEEIFTRGFIQGHLAPLSSISVKLLFFRVDLPTLISALFFASMHFSLLLSGVNTTTMTVTFLFTFSLGLIAGHQRARTGSLLPAIGLHMLGNIGGLCGGIIYAVIRILSGGRPPGM